ncbi:MAG TPA: dTDP-glucose 4,6-dehydratase [Hyphomicrobiales bacterium]|nr:dTDP-glucose 4,6-dehydratase [Hyphomicrobiales bacterium]
MKRLLVTGGAGFIGANFVHYWLREQPQDTVVVLDALTYAGNRDNLQGLDSHSGYNFVHGDIRDQALVEQLLVQQQIDTLVHFAAESHVDRSISGPDAFIDTNIIGTHALLKAARAVWSATGGFAGKRFHHVSTDEVYGSLSPTDPAFTETTAYAPNSPYSASKAASDHLVRAYHHTFGLPVSTSNCSNNYGPYQFPEKLLPLCLLNILHGRALPIYGDGQQVRDWLHVDDHNHGIALILAQGQIGETYNIGGHNEWANLDTVKLLCRLVDQLFAQDSSLAQRFPQSPAARGESASLITFVTDRLGHDTRYAIDAGKIGRALGYHPQVSFEEGLRQTVAWYLNNETWWRALQARQAG